MTCMIGPGFLVWVSGVGGISGTELAFKRSRGLLVTCGTACLLHRTPAPNAHAAHRRAGTGVGLVGLRMGCGPAR